MAKIVENHNSVYANPSDTKENWEAINPIIPDGVLVIESDTEKMKRGDGVTRYIDRPYIAGEGGGGSTIEGLTTAGLAIPIDDSAILANFGLPQGYLDTAYADYDKAIINVKWNDSGKESLRPKSITAKLYNEAGEALASSVLNSSNSWSTEINAASYTGPFNILLTELIGYKRTVSASVSGANKTFAVTYARI